MKEVLECVMQILLIVVLILQIAFLIYFAYINHKRFQDDKKCWEQRDKVAKEIHDLAEEIEIEYKKYLEHKSELDFCDKLADDSKECAEDEETAEDTREDTDKK